MSSEANKQSVAKAMEGLSHGDGRTFVDLMSDDFTWTYKGSTNWRGSYRGKSTVRSKLLAPLFDNFDGTYKNMPRRIISEGDIVVVECEGSVATKAGERYDNKYCYVIRMAEGKMVELTEYMDTALADRVLAPPND